MKRHLLLLTFLLIGTSAATAEDPVAVAYYFPNWHRRPGQTGDRFGEWPNIPRALPRFPGHQQPKRPLWRVEDEANPAVMAKKIDTAADHEIGAFLFCWYYHEQGPYLDRALNEGYLKAANRARVPFALMWANHDVGGSTGRKGAVSREVFERMARLIIDRYFASWDRHWKASRLHFPNVTMGWDPTPRLRPDQPHTGKGYPDSPVVTGNTPERFRAALEQARDRALLLPPERRVVTIYAWNEWTEGGYLEPEQRTGMEYLEAVRDIFGSAGVRAPPSSTLNPASP